MTTSCELSLSVHSVFYLTRQPLHTLHKEMNIKILIVWGWRVERDVLKVQTNQLRFIVRSVSASSISPHLIEPFSSDGVACTDMPGLVHQPLQAEGLGHFHAGHCVPATRESISPLSRTFIIIHLLSILLAKKRIGSRLAWMSGCCKKSCEVIWCISS